MDDSSRKPNVKWLTSADGTIIYADSLGDPSKPAIVWIHGFSMSGLSFDAIFNDPLWTDHVYLVRYDLRGHGRSGKPTAEEAWESKRLCEDYEAVVQAFDLKRPYVLGWSLGGIYIADILSFHPPSYVAGIIHVTAVPHTDLNMQKFATPEVCDLLPSLWQTTDVDAFQKGSCEMVKLFSDSFSSQERQNCLGDIMIQPRAICSRLMFRTQDTTGFYDAGRKGLPLLVIIAKRDRIVQGKELLSFLAGWAKMKVIELEDADHFPWLSQPFEFRESILAWVKETGEA